MMQFFNKFKKNIKNNSIEKLKEIEKIIDNEETKIPQLLINLFDKFYYYFSEKKYFKYSNINNKYEDVMNYIFQDKKRETEFQNTLKNNNLKSIVSLEFPNISLTFLDNNNILEIANLAIILYKIKSLNLKNKLQFYIYNSPFKREILTKDFLTKNNPRKLFNYYHKNSIGLTVGGITVSDSYSATAIEEEKYKLFFHETIHYLSFDTREGRNDAYEKMNFGWCNNFSKIFEGYTEFIAIIYHIILNISKLKYLYNLIDNEIIKLFTIFIKIEQIWSIYIVTKLLKLSGYTCDNFKTFFIKTNNCIEINFDKIAIFSYYFVKSILLFNIYSLFDFDCFNKDLKATDKYYFMEKNLFLKINPQYFDLMEKCFKLLDSNINLKIKTNSISYICIELEDMNKEDLNKIIEINEIQNGGNNYYYKYLKYKKKYIKLKEI
jgi:hypothetical protein